MALEQAPEGAGVALHAVVCGNHEDRVVKGREGPLGLGAKVHVAGASTSVRRAPARSSSAWAAKMVMPRSRSMASVSRWESPRLDAAKARDAPRVVEHASASVVLPASTRARICR